MYAGSYCDPSSNCSYTENALKAMYPVQLVHDEALNQAQEDFSWGEWVTAPE